VSRRAPGWVGVPGVTVSLDGSRNTVTDAAGRYMLEEVAEGPHKIAIDLRELPAEYQLGEQNSLPVGVRARKIARADLEVVRLGGGIEGKVEGAAAGMRLNNNVVVMLSPGNRYTTCEENGAFGFFNLPPGEYEVALDAETLPEFYVVVSDAKVKAGATSDVPQPRLKFVIEKREPQLPIRKVFGGQASISPAR
jgi:hypothetical protein